MIRQATTIAKLAPQPSQMGLTPGIWPGAPDIAGKWHWSDLAWARGKITNRKFYSNLGNLGNLPFLAGKWSYLARPGVRIPRSPGGEIVVILVILVILEWGRIPTIPRLL